MLVLALCAWLFWRGDGSLEIGSSKGAFEAPAAKTELIKVPRRRSSQPEKEKEQKERERK
jgi:hypothetical protein